MYDATCSCLSDSWIQWWLISSVSCRQLVGAANPPRLKTLPAMQTHCPVCLVRQEHLLLLHCQGDRHTQREREQKVPVVLQRCIPNYSVY